MNLTKRFQHLVSVIVIVALACLLYLPFLGNPPVFDDKGFFSGRFLSYFATHPLGWGLRLPSYFSLAFVEVLWGHIAAHRILALAMHAACALALYKLIYDLFLSARSANGASHLHGVAGHAATWGLIGAALFVIQPMAVYGAGYLIQRSIVLATLFSLLSLILFVRGLTRRSHADAVSAALLFSLAVLSKEHSVLLPAVAALAVPLIVIERRFALRHVFIYWLACAPAAIFVALLSKGLIGAAYEPDFGQVAIQLENVFGQDIAGFPWALSAVTQAGLFFNYLALWLWPNVHAMSIDLRIDFLGTWSAGWISLKVGAFAAYGAIGFLLLRRGGRAGLVGFGLLYVWVLYLVEFSTARFQEPFVLYRSYLWAPGLFIALAAALSAVPRRIALAVFVLVIPVLLFQAHDRLVTFSSSLRLWEDAVAKLPEKPVPWGSRTLYNLGREYLYDGRPDQAIKVTELCMARYPDTFHCYSARGAIHLQMEQYELAQPFLERALELQPKDAITYHHLGLVLENLGRVPEAKALYHRSSELGYLGGDYELLRLEHPGSGLLAPKKKKTPASR
jgi:tetratricopeptide (TPR) repeat protein